MYSILLVDDDAIMRIGVKTMLRGSGDFYIAGEAENGCAAGLHQSIIKIDWH